jgi:DNA polymerase I-like protein with 3'-5' exonuclease and polymerase domains
MTRKVNYNDMTLFEAKPEWADMWKGMPSYEHTDLMPQRTLKIHFRNREDFEAFTRLVDQTVGPNQHAIWYPRLEIRTAADKRFVADSAVSPRYPIYIISKGRWESRMTSRALEKINVHYRICVEPQEYEQYAAVIDPAKVLRLPEDFSKLRQGSIPVRNWVWEHSIAEGHARHWIMDDNIRGFYRFENNLKVPVGDGAIFRAAEDFTDRYENVGQSGLQYYMFVIAKWGDRPPITLNTRIYSCILNRNDLPFRWRGRYNEDTDLSIRVLKSGMCTILFNAFLAEKMRTMTMKGGNMEELYKGEGRLRMAQSLAEQHPDVVHITEKWGRPQHEVYYKRFQRKNKLILRRDVAVPDAQDDYGMRMERVEPSRSASRLLRAEAFQVRGAPPPSDWAAPAELPSLRGVRRLSFDTETRDEELKSRGPGPRRPDCYIVGLALGTDDGRRFYLPVRHEGDGNLDSVTVFNWARSELNSFNGELVGANLIYDLDFAANEGITFPKVKVFHDVQVAEPLLDEWRLRYDLDALANSYLGISKSDALLRKAALAYGFGADDGDVKRNLWRLPAAYVGGYAEGDVDLPLRILERQLPMLEEEGLSDVYDVERKLIPILLAMRRRGVRVDLDRVQQVRGKMVERRDELLARVRSMAGPKAELMAPESFVAALRERGLIVPVTPKTGKPSVTKGFLKAHRADPLCASLIEAREVNTIINTFLDGHVLGHQIRGRVHCQFHQLKNEDGGGTIARLSSSDPNLQNIPSRDEELGPLVRSIFVPDEGELWERHDLSQIEYRYLVHFAVGPGADEARKKYTEDPEADFHAMCGEFMGIDARGAARRQVKSINFCKVYGGGIPKLADSIGCSQDEAKTFNAKYDRALPFVGDTYRATAALAVEKGYITDVLGRRQRFSLWEPADNYGHKNPPMRRDSALAAYGPNITRYKTYAALNRCLQASAASHAKKAMVDCWEAGIQQALGPQLVTVHDESGYSVPPTRQAEEAVAEAKRIMETAIPLRVPVIADASRGKNWGDTK